MNDIVVLQDTLNPISAQERVKINQNWDALRRGFSSLQNQISFLSGGAEVDGILARIERVIQDAQTNTQNAIDNVNNNYAEKLVEINQSLTDLSAALTSSQMATDQANEARDNAVNATNDALAAINQIQLVISNFSSRGDFVLGTQYYKGNIVSNGQGSSYIAKQDNINLPLTNIANWVLLASRGLQGVQGEKGETGSGFLVKGYFSNIQELESAIPSPETGDAYGIGTEEPYDIYIYDGINNAWVNNGALQGAKGERGDVGPEGPKGENGKDAEVTEQSIEFALGFKPANKTVLENHINESVVSEEGAHNIRYFDETLSIKGDDDVWREVAAGEKIDDKTNSPGPKTLIAGNMQAGYFGTVQVSQFFTGEALALMAGITAGTSQNSNTSWLKFAYQGKILFRPMKAIRHSISWDNINSAGCVFGTKTVVKNGVTFIVRLMKGSNVDPAVTANNATNTMKGSEWNKLMLPIHEQAATKAWAYPNFVEDNVPNWGIGYTDADLLTNNTQGNGSYVWCQEISSANTANRVVRGYNGVSFANTGEHSLITEVFGWVPILEVSDL